MSRLPSSSSSRRQGLCTCGSCPECRRALRADPRKSLRDPYVKPLTGPATPSAEYLRLAAIPSRPSPSSQPLLVISLDGVVDARLPYHLSGGYTDVLSRPYLETFLAYLLSQQSPWSFCFYSSLPRKQALKTLRELNMPTGGPEKDERDGVVAYPVSVALLDHLRDLVVWMRKHLPEYAAFCNENPIFKGRLSGVGHLDLAGCLALGVTGPPLRATGYDWDLRKTQPYCDYDTYDFDVATWDTCDCYGRFRIRLEEMDQSVRILKQCLKRLEDTQGDRHMVEDPHIAWPAELALGPDGQGNSNEHIRHIMGESMEALIHHFKIVTEGFRVPAGQVYQAIEGAGGELGCHLVSDGGVRPYRSHLRDPGFVNVQSLPAMCEGGMLSDVVPSLASLDPVMGGVDR